MAKSQNLRRRYAGAPITPKLSGTSGNYGNRPIHISAGATTMSDAERSGKKLRHLQQLLKSGNSSNKSAFQSGRSWVAGFKNRGAGLTRTCDIQRREAGLSCTIARPQMR
jgi:hypothetical protein